MKFSATDIFFALSNIETGYLSDKFIINCPKYTLVNGYGPIQITTGKLGIIQFFLYNYTYLFSDNELQYLNRLENQAKILNLINNIDLNKYSNLSIYDYGKNGDLYTKKDRILYKSSCIKILEKILENTNYNLNNFIYYWVNLKWNKNSINNLKKKKYYYNLIIKYISNKNINIINNINSKIMYYAHNIDLFKENKLHVLDKSQNQGCAFFVGRIINQATFSAWLFHNIHRKKILYSAYKEVKNKYNFKLYPDNLEKKNISKSYNSYLEDIFNQINHKPWINVDKMIKDISYKIAPSIDEYKKYLDEGNIVGMFYPKSTYHKFSFFESSLNRLLTYESSYNDNLFLISKKTGASITDLIKINNLDKFLFKENDILRIPKLNNLNKYEILNYVVKKNDSIENISNITKVSKINIIKLNNLHYIKLKFKKIFYFNKDTESNYYNIGSVFNLNSQYWKPKFLTKKYKFNCASEILLDNNYFAFNTHMGIVAKIANKLFIFHNAGGDILLTPLEKLEPNYYIMWVIKN